MSQTLYNNVFNRIAQGISNSDTTVTVQDGSDFPTPAVGDFYLCTLVGIDPNSGQEDSWEIVKVTAKPTVNSFTVVRAQEGTTALAWAQFTDFQMRITAATVVMPDGDQTLSNKTIQSSTIDSTSVGATTPASVAATTLSAATSATLPANTSIGTITSTELGYVDGVTSAIQTQLDAKYQANSDPTFGDATVDSLQFSGGTGTQGTMSWNTDESTVDLIVDSGETIQLGQETEYNVRNNTGSTIPKGSAVMSTGTIGASSRITIGLMNASVLDNEIDYLGIASEDIAASSDGKVTFFGKISGVDTSSFSDGDTLWLDQGVNGALTATEPALGIKVPAAYVINADANGTIMARWSRSPGLHDLHDVTLTSETNNEILQYNSSNSSWRNRTFTEADIAAASALTALDTAAVKTTTNFGGDVSGTYNAIVVANDSHTHQFSNITSKPTTLSGYGITDGISTTGGSSSDFLKADGSTDSSAYVTGLTLDQVSSKTTATGAISTSATSIEAGRGSGSVALTTNDGQGDANVTFNHKSGTADFAGNVGRITVNTDSTTGASMTFGLASNAATGAATSTAELVLTETAADFQDNNISTTGSVSATGGFTGALTGTATQLNINTSGSTSTFPVTWHSGNLVYSTANVTIQPSTGKLTAGGGFVGDLTGTASSASAVPWSGVSSTPTTLSGYGITDAVTTNTTQNITGVKEFQDDIELRFGNSADARIEWLGASNIMYSRVYTDGGYYQWAADDAGTTVRNLILAGDIDGNSTSQVRLYYQGSEKLRTKSDGITVSGTVYSTEGNSSQWDQAYDNYIASVAFNTTNGVLTLTQRDGGTITEDLDGRYLTAAVNNYVTGASFNIATETLTLTRSGLTDLTTSFAGYLKDGEANNYVHPSYNGDDFSVDTGALTGATVVSDVDINVTTDSLGHVTDANGTIATRTLTLANLGYTGATNANNYVHPSYNGDDFSVDTGALTGATVVSDIDINVTTDSLGHVTDANGVVATRTLTAANIGAPTTTGTNASGTWGISITGTAGNSTTSRVTADSAGNRALVLCTADGTTRNETLYKDAGTSLYFNTSNNTLVATTFSGALSGNATTATTATTATNCSRSVVAGTGLYGGGALSGNVTINQYSAVSVGGTATLADGTFRTVTSSGATVTLPASPAAGDTVYISNGPYTNTIIARNGQNIMGLAENLTLDVANIGVTLIFADSTRGWRLM